MIKKGKLITLEGIDGAGKSTHLTWLRDFLLRRGIDVVVTREPGGTPLGEKLRELLLNHSMHPETEVLLLFAARREHLEKVILPALRAGKWVVSDRFTDASFAYQGGGRGVAAWKLEALEEWVQEGLQPDLTLLLDAPVEVAKQRLFQGSRDRFEGEQDAFFQAVRKAYLDRAARFPERIRIIDSAQGVEKVQAELERIITIHCL